MSSVKHCQKNRDGRPDKPRKTTRNAGWKTRTPSTEHDTTRRNWPVQHWCIAMWCCWPRLRTNCGSFIKTSGTSIVAFVEPISNNACRCIYAFLLVLCAHSILNRAKIKIQMTPAQRRIRFRCLRRSRRGLKQTFVGRSQQTPKPMNKTDSMGWQKTVCVKNQKQHRLSRNTVNEKRLAKQTRHSPFEITPARVRNKRISVRTDALTLRHETSFKPRRIFNHPKENEYFTSTFC